MNELIESWEINNRINLYLLEGIPEEHLADVSLTKGRNVGEQFAHLHNVRLMWLKTSEPALMHDLEKLEKENLSRARLHNSLSASAKAISSLLTQATKTGKIKGFKPHATAFAAYLIAHESHHRALILQALKQSGHPIDKKIAYGIWEWGVR